MDCARREFSEETGMPMHQLQLVDGVGPLDEVFTGCNNVRYKHVYFLAEAAAAPACDMPHFAPCESFAVTDKVQAREIRSVAWLSYDEAASMIHEHNGERRDLFARVHQHVTAFISSVAV